MNESITAKDLYLSRLPGALHAATNADRFQVIIVGAGPAGSLAAELLARGGVRVALCDGRPAVKAKPCGGGVTSKALKRYPFLQEAAARLIDDLEMYAPGGRRLALKLDEPFAVFSRRTLDDFLRERARAAGAEVIAEKVSFTPRASEAESWQLRGAASGVNLSAAFLVGADGANSRIAKLMAGALPNEEMEVAFGYRTPLPQNENDAPTVVAFLPGYAGYAWAFPRLDHLSFGIATSQDAFAHDALDKMLWDFMRGYYRQRADKGAHLWRARHAADVALDERNEKLLRGTAERYAARIPGLASETWDTRHAAGANWALLGDAAGFADPVTGEGIYYALRSAELFAESFLADGATSYEARWRADFGAELKRASQMRRRFYGQFLGAPFTDRMIQFSRFHPRLRRILGELVAGDQGYVNLKRTLARRAVTPF